ncbi:MAG TPA: hypothetical protein VF787_10120 [Thermoanaerobaculia bacterium]
MNTRTSTPVIGTSLLLLFVLILSQPLQAGGRRRVVAASPSSLTTIEFLGTTGVLDAGTIAWNGKQRSTIQTRTVAMRIGPPSREARGAVTLQAFIEIPDARCTVRVNGVTLGNAPRVVARNVPAGITTTQRIEIEVPINAPDGPLQLSIGWAAN